MMSVATVSDCGNMMSVATDHGNMMSVATDHGNMSVATDHDYECSNRSW